MTFSRETIELFANLIGQVRFDGGDPELEEHVAVVVTAKRELEAAAAELAEQEKP